MDDGPLVLSNLGPTETLPGLKRVATGSLQVHDALVRLWV